MLGRLCAIGPKKTAKLVGFWASFLPLILESGARRRSSATSRSLWRNGADFLDYR